MTFSYLKGMGRYVLGAVTSLWEKKMRSSLMPKSLQLGFEFQIEQVQA